MQPVILCYDSIFPENATLLRRVATDCGTRAIEGGPQNRLIAAVEAIALPMIAFVDIGGYCLSVPLHFVVDGATSCHQHYQNGQLWEDWSPMGARAVKDLCSAAQCVACLIYTVLRLLEGIGTLTFKLSGYRDALAEQAQRHQTEITGLTDQLQQERSKSEGLNDQLQQERSKSEGLTNNLQANENRCRKLLQKLGQQKAKQAELLQTIENLEATAGKYIETQAQLVAKLENVLQLNEERDSLSQQLADCQQRWQALETEHQKCAQKAELQQQEKASLKQELEKCQQERLGLENQQKDCAHQLALQAKKYNDQLNSMSTLHLSAFNAIKKEKQEAEQKLGVEKKEILKKAINENIQLKNHNHMQMLSVEKQFFVLLKLQQDSMQSQLTQLQKENQALQQRSTDLQRQLQEIRKSEASAAPLELLTIPPASTLTKSSTSSGTTSSSSTESQASAPPTLPLELLRRHLETAAPVSQNPISLHLSQQAFHSAELWNMLLNLSPEQNFQKITLYKEGFDQPVLSIEKMDRYPDQFTEIHFELLAPSLDAYIKMNDYKNVFSISNISIDLYDTPAQKKLSFTSGVNNLSFCIEEGSKILDLAEYINSVLRMSFLPLRLKKIQGLGYYDCEAELNYFNGKPKLTTETEDFLKEFKNKEKTDSETEWFDDKRVTLFLEFVLQTSNNCHFDKAAELSPPIDSVPINRGPQLKYPIGILRTPLTSTPNPGRRQHNEQCRIS